MPLPAALSIRRAMRSETSLKVLQSQISAKAAGAAGVDLVKWGVNVKANTVKVAVRSDPAAAQAYFDEQFGIDAVSVSWTAERPILLR